LAQQPVPRVGVGGMVAHATSAAARARCQNITRDKWAALLQARRLVQQAGAHCQVDARAGASSLQDVAQHLDALARRTNGEDHCTNVLL
jgi:hypothetical protein